MPSPVGRLQLAPPDPKFVPDGPDTWGTARDLFNPLPRRLAANRPLKDNLTFDGIHRDVTEPKVLSVLETPANLRDDSVIVLAAPCPLGPSDPGAAGPLCHRGPVRSSVVPSILHQSPPGGPASDVPPSADTSVVR